MEIAKSQCQEKREDELCRELFSEKSSGVVNHSPTSIWTEIFLGILALVFICSILTLIYIFVKRPDIDLKGFIPLWMNPFKGSSKLNLNSQPNSSSRTPSPYDYTYSDYTSKQGEIPSFLIDVKDEAGRDIRKKNSLVLKKKGSNQSFNKTLDPSLKQVTVLREFIPTLKDELHLQLGQHVQVTKEFDDGWATGLIIETRQEGVFPLICTTENSSNPCQDENETENPWNQHIISKRMSSKSFKRVPSASKFTLERHLFTNKNGQSSSEYQNVKEQDEFE